MSSFEIAFITIAIVAALFTAVCAYFAFRCTAGWRVWFLSFVARIYIRIFIRWSCNKPCPYPADGPAIIVGNHTSPVDPILIWHRHNIGWPRHALRAIGFLVAREYVVRKDIVGWVCRSMQSIPINRAGRDMAGVRQALARLKDNQWLGIFPEGHINLEPEKGFKEFNTGAAFISLKSGVPIYPVYIHDAPRSTSMVACFFKRATVHITYGEPIVLVERFGDVKLNTDTLREATQVIVEELQRLETVQ